MKNEKLLGEWKERLGLQDWVIVIKDMCKPCELEQSNMGQAEYNHESKDALIKIADPVLGDFEISFDYEPILVHELLHLKFSLVIVPNDKMHFNHMHQLIDDMARALVMAKRGETKR